jgi:hypothetical protein
MADPIPITKDDERRWREILDDLGPDLVQLKLLGRLANPVVDASFLALCERTPRRQSPSSRIGFPTDKLRLSGGIPRAIGLA